MTSGWSRTDVIFVAAVAVVFVFAVVVPAVRRTRDEQIFAEPTRLQRRWRRPPD